MVAVETGSSVHVLLPFVVVLLAIGVLLVFSAVPALPVKVPASQAINSVLFVIVPLFYIPVSRSTYVLLDCVQLANGEYVIDSDPSVACYDSVWWRTFPVALLGLVVFVIGFPAYFVLLLSSSRESLMDPATFAKYGDLYKLFRVSYYWGGVADLIKGLSIVTVAVFVANQVLLIGFLIAIVVSALLFVATRRPYYFDVYNNVQFRLLLALLAILCAGGGSYAEKTRETSSGSHLFLAIVVLALIAVAIITVHGVFVEIRHIVGQRKGQYSPAQARRFMLARHVALEARDANPEDAPVVHRFLSELSGRNDHLDVWDSSVGGSDEIELGELDVSGYGDEEQQDSATTLSSFGGVVDEERKGRRRRRVVPSGK